MGLPRNHIIGEVLAVAKTVSYVGSTCDKGRVIGILVAYQLFATVSNIGIAIKATVLVKLPKNVANLYLVSVVMGT